MKKFLSLVLAVLMVTTIASVAWAEDNPLWAKPEEEVTLEFWYPLSGLYGDLLLQMVAEYEAENPEIHINASYSGNYSETATKVATNMAAGNVPDVVIGVDSGYTVGRGNHLFAEELMADPEYAIDDVFQGFKEQSMYANEMGASPFSSSTCVMFYNKDILNACNLDMVADAPKSWEDFMAVCATVTEKGNINNSDVFYAFDTNDPTWLYFSMLGQLDNHGVSFNEQNEYEITYVNESAVPAAQLWRELAASGCMPIGEHANSNNAFKAGNLAFWAGSSSWAPQFHDLDFEVGAIIMPSFADTPNMVLGGTSIVLLSTDPVRQAASWDFIKWMTSAEHHKDWAIGAGYLPIRASELELDSVQEAIANDEMVSVCFAQSESAWCYPSFEHWSPIYSSVSSMLELIEEGADVETTMSDTLEEVRAEIDY